MAKSYTKIEFAYEPWTGPRSPLLSSATATRLHLILAGRLQLSLGEERLEVGPGSVIWSPPSKKARGRVIGDEVQRLTMHLRSGAWAPAHQADAEALSLIERFSQISRQRGSCLPCTASTFAALEHEMRRLIDIWHKPQLRHHHCSLKAGAIQLLVLLDNDPSLHRFEMPDNAKPSTRAIDRIEAALHYLELPAYITQEHLSVSDLARLCGYRTSQFHALFVEATGLTPQRYLTERRIAMACDLLSQGSQRVLEIAFSCGFNSQSRFYHAFKSIMGVSPARVGVENVHSTSVVDINDLLR